MQCWCEWHQHESNFLSGDSFGEVCVDSYKFINDGWGIEDHFTSCQFMLLFGANGALCIWYMSWSWEVWTSGIKILTSWILLVTGRWIRDTFPLIIEPVSCRSVRNSIHHYDLFSLFWVWSKLEWLCYNKSFTDIILITPCFFRHIAEYGSISFSVIWPWICHLMRTFNNSVSVW